jgi:hypothetical protein
MNPRLQRDKAREAREEAARKAQQPPAPSEGIPAQGKPESQEFAAEEAQGPLTPFDGSVQPSARPSGDVQLKPR